MHPFPDDFEKFATNKMMSYNILALCASIVVWLLWFLFWALCKVALCLGHWVVYPLALLRFLCVIRLSVRWSRCVMLSWRWGRRCFCSLGSVFEVGSDPQAWVATPLLCTSGWRFPRALLSVYSGGVPADSGWGLWTLLVANVGQSVVAVARLTKQELIVVNFWHHTH